MNVRSFLHCAQITNLTTSLQANVSGNTRQSVKAEAGSSWTNVNCHKLGICLTWMEGLGDLFVIAMNFELVQNAIMAGGAPGWFCGMRKWVAAALGLAAVPVHPPTAPTGLKWALPPGLGSPTHPQAHSCNWIWHPIHSQQRPNPFQFADTVCLVWPLRISVSFTGASYYNGRFEF